MIDVRDALGELIVNSGLKYKVVAERANLTPQKLCDTIKKRRKLDANEFVDVCRAIGVKPDDVYFIATPKTARKAPRLSGRR